MSTEDKILTTLIRDLRIMQDAEDERNGDAAPQTARHAANKIEALTTCLHWEREKAERYRLVTLKQDAELAALREDNVKLKKVIRDQGDEIRALHIVSDAVIDAARTKEGQP